MQPLLGGADCSTSSNPLKQVAQREAVDQSLFRDRLVSKPGQSSSTRAQLPSTALGPRPQTRAQPFNLSNLSSALAESSQSRSAQSSPGPGIHQQIPRNGYDAAWNNAASGPRHAVLPGPSRHTGSPMGQGAFGPSSGQTSDWAQSFQDGIGKGKGRADPAQISFPLGQQQYPAPQQRLYQPQFEGYQPYRPQIGYQPFASHLHSPIQAPGRDQGVQAALRSEEEQKALEEAFEKALADAQLQRGKDQGKPDGSRAKEKEDQDEIQEIKRDEGGDRERGDLEAVWQSLRPEAERLNQLAEWEKDFSQFVDGEDDLYDTLNDSLYRNSGVGQAGLDEQMDLGPFGPGFMDDMRADDGLPVHREYDFASASSNPPSTENVQSCWTRANELFHNGGSLSEVTDLLETFILRASSEDYQAVQASAVEAWSLLGQTHAMNEKEEKALAAFEEGREAMKGIDTTSVRGVGETFTNLAISYVNESLDLAALTTLHQHLVTSYPAQAAGPAPLRSGMPEEASPWFLHERLRDSYLDLARRQYNDKGQVDPHVQVGLGTLYYMMGEYGEARDCWVAALEERPDDYLLWNRLGATLANGGNSEEAVDAYRRALELRPTFTRAIFNLGVACLSIGVHKEAAEHFLSALALHRGHESRALPPGPDQGSVGQGDSTELWLVLRRALVALNLDELADQARPGTDLTVFKRAGFEF